MNNTLVHIKTTWLKIATEHGLDVTDHPVYDPFGCYFEDTLTNEKLRAARTEYLTAMNSTHEVEYGRKVETFTFNQHAARVFYAAIKYRSFAAWATRRIDGDATDWSVWDMTFSTRAEIDVELKRLRAAVIAVEFC